jgi:sugar lactone lactonase YvrE
MRIRALALLAALPLTACVDDHVQISGCEPVGELRPVCGMQTPEDMAALPDGRHLLLANFGGMHDGTGYLSLFDTASEQSTRLFPPENGVVDTADESWGDAGCGPPPLDRFSPHGTHLHRLADGRWRFLVVNHGGRETIELFEVLGQGAETALAWRGCVRAAPETFINDVVGLSGGDLVYTRMFHNGGRLEQLLGLLGRNTGDLWRWNREAGLRVLPGTEASQPNGIEIAPDERHVFANMYFTGEVWKVDVNTGDVVATAPVAHGDNSAWGSDGRLWVVTHQDSLPNLLSCFEEQSTPCGARFEVFALDPGTMAAESVFVHQGAPMGAATVAVPQGGRIYFGSFVGDRLMSMPDPGRAR